MLLLLSCSVMSDSMRPHRRQPIRLPHPWDSPGKNTGVGCHFLLPAFAHGSSEVTVGFFFFFFGLFDLWSRICPNCTCVKLFLVPYSLFVFCCSRRGVSRRKHCGTAAEDPKSQLVSDIPRVTETYQQRFGLVAPYQPIRSL